LETDVPSNVGLSLKVYVIFSVSLGKRIKPACDLKTILEKVFSDGADSGVASGQLGLLLGL
jgi:hypothetical protein